MNALIVYTNGQASAPYETIQLAANALLTEYPEGVLIDAGGFEVYDDTPDSDYDVRAAEAARFYEHAGKDCAIATIEVHI